VEGHLDNPTLPQGATADSISLLLGHPDPTTLATPAFQAAVGRVMASPQAYHALEYGDEQGDPALIEYLVARISGEQGIALSRENVMIVGGSTHAVDMIARLYTQPGGAVIVEAPTYVDALHIFRDHGVELHSVAVDEDGVVIGEFERLLKGLAAENNLPSVFYAIPNFHNPTGITMSIQRRLEVIRLAREYGFRIAEDDVYRELAFGGDIPPSFYTLANGENVIQIGSFSKTLAPGLRLGWVIAAGEAIQRFVSCGTTQMGGGANPLAARIVAEYCRSGDWDAHLVSLRSLYRERRDTMLAALGQYMPPEVGWTTPAGGFFVWVRLPDGTKSAMVKERAAKRGVIVAAGGGYFLNPDDGNHHLRLTYSFASLSDIQRAIQILAEVISG
jgi:2-aminoadipate transaminase